MGIEIIVNGYYRSGTTLTWNILKESLPGHLCFYEPLHPDLAFAVRAELMCGEADKLHRLNLWDDYVRLVPEIRAKILRNNPNTGGDGILNDTALENYLDIFAKLEEPVVLQPNRLHYHLDLAARRYRPRIIHIVRHPLDVFASMQTMFLDIAQGGPKRGLKQLTKPYTFSRSRGFDLDKEFQWIKRRVGYPLPAYDSWKVKHLENFDAFGKFVVVWTVANCVAMQSVAQHKGYLLVYERLLQDQDAVFAELSQFLGLEIRKRTDLRTDNCFKFDRRELARIRRKVGKYALEEEFDRIVQTIRDQGIDYL